MESGLTPEKRCERCGWPIVPDGQPGCWESNCSMRPMPDPTPPTGREPGTAEADPLSVCANLNFLAESLSESADWLDGEIERSGDRSGKLALQSAGKRESARAIRKATACIEQLRRGLASTAAELTATRLQRDAAVIALYTDYDDTTFQSIAVNIDAYSGEMFRPFRDFITKKVDLELAKLTETSDGNG